MSAFWKRLVLIILLFIVSLLILTPTFTLDVITTTFKRFEGNSLFKELLNYAKGMVVIFINFIVIPFLIKVSVELEDYQTKSDQNIVTIRRIFFFMVFNTLLLPVVGVNTGVALFNAFKEKGVNTPTYLAQNILNRQQTFIIFIMNLTFITNTNSLFDFSHKVSYWIGKKLHERKQKKSHYQT